MKKVDLTTYIFITICSIVIPPLFVINLVVLLIQLIPRIVVVCKERQEMKEDESAKKIYTEMMAKSKNGMCEDEKSDAEVKTVSVINENRIIYFSGEEKRTLWVNISAFNSATVDEPELEAISKSLQTFTNLLLIDMVTYKMAQTVKEFFQNYRDSIPDDIKDKLPIEFFSCLDDIITILERN